MRSLFLSIIGLILIASPAAADRFGLTDPKAIERFEIELNEILLAPPVSQPRNDAPNFPDDRELHDLIKMDQGLEEAWRADPSATLALIKRIREASEGKN